MSVSAAPPQPRGNGAVGQQTAKIVALFREHAALLSDDGETIQLQYLEQVLRIANPEVFTVSHVHLLCAAMKGENGGTAASSMEATFPVPIDAFIRFVLNGRSVDMGSFDEAQEEAEGAPAEGSPACVDHDNAAALKAAALASAAEDPPAIRVRKLNGALVLTVGSLRAESIDVGTLRNEVIEAICNGENSGLDVELLVGVERLQDSSALLHPMVPEGGVLEVMLCLQDLPTLDPNKEHIDQLDVLVKMLECHVVEKQRTGLVHLRKLLSIERNPPVQAVIESGALPKFLEFAKDKSGGGLAFEALWCLTNVASGTTEQTTQIVEMGAVPVFIDTISDPDTTLDDKEQAVWALGNIAGDSPGLRNIVLDSGAVDALLALLTFNNRLGFRRNLAWTVSNLVRGKPKPDFDVVAPVVPAVIALVLHEEDAEVLADACWSLSYLSDGPDMWLERVLAHHGIVPRLMSLVARDGREFQTPALRTIGNFCTGQDQSTQMVIDAGFLRVAQPLLTHQKRGVRKETLWALSNIAAGTVSQIEAILESGLIQAVLKIAKEDEYEVKKEALWIIDNMSSGGKVEQVQVLVNEGGLEPLMQAIGINGGSTWPLQQRGLNGIKNILEKGQALAEQASGENPFANEIVNCYGLEWLDEMEFDDDAGDGELDEIRRLLGNFRGEKARSSVE